MKDFSLGIIVLLVILSLFLAHQMSTKKGELEVCTAKLEALENATPIEKLKDIFPLKNQ